MKLTILLMLVLVFTGTDTFAQKNFIRYETQEIPNEDCIANANDVQFVIFSFGKNHKQMQADKIYLRDAIHAVIFRGIPSCGVKPLYSKPQGNWSQDEKKFWKKFFAVKNLDSWEKEKKTAPFVNYSNFASESGSPSPEWVTKQGKYMKIGIPIRVQRETLRDYLKSEGIDVY